MTTFDKFNKKYKKYILSEGQKRCKDKSLIKKYKSNIDFYDKRINKVTNKINKYYNKNYEFQLSILNLGEYGLAFVGHNLIKIDPRIALINKSFLTFICAHECAHMLHYEQYKMNSTEEWADTNATIYMANNNIDIKGTIKILMKLPKRNNGIHPEPRVRAFNIYNIYYQTKNKIY